MFKKISIFLCAGLFVIAFNVSGLASAPKTQIYYFHSSVRCMTCNKIEKYTREAIEQSFAKQIEDGRVVFKMVNTDKKENKHFLKDYGLYTKSVVLSKTIDGKEAAFKNLNQIWTLVRNENAFKKYIADETAAFIKE